MTGLQKVFFGVGIAAILGLGVVVYRQFAAPVAVAPATNTVEEGGRTDVANKAVPPVPVPETPATPDAIANDIAKEIDTDNSTLNNETQGETSQIQADGAAVSDFSNVYDETK